MVPDSVGKLFNLSFLLDYQVFGLPTITTKIVYQYLRQLDICFVHCAKRISRNSYIGFGKSYLIPETTNFDIGEGIVYQYLRQLDIWIFVSGKERSGFPETLI